MADFKIEIVSDTVCPWCYVGYKKLQNAISMYKSEHPEANFAITWKPYYLNPNAPVPGVDKTQYYQSKFGVDRTSAIFSRLSQVGADVGITFKFGGKTGNSRESHRLIQLGAVKQKQTEVVEQLFKAYFEEEKDITAAETLLEAAIRSGLDKAEVKEWLGSEKDGDVVDGEVRDAKNQHITGVPNFTINEKHVLGGAQDPNQFMEIFKKIV